MDILFKKAGAILMIIALPPLAGSSDFLYYTFDPATAALGEGTSSSQVGAVSALINPASVSWEHHAGIYASHLFLSLDRRISSFAASVPVGERAALGVGVLQAAISDIDGRDANGRHTEYLSDTSNLVAFVFSVRPAPRMSVGISVRALFRSTGEEKASGVAFDAGTRFRIMPGLTAALVGRNIGLTKPQNDSYGAYWSWNTSYWGDELRIQKDDRIPPAVGLSATMENLPGDIRLIAGFLKIEGESLKVSGGVEFPVDDRLLLRAGGQWDRPNAGMRLLMPFHAANLSMDYAFGRGEITSDTVHRVSISSAF